MISDIYLMSSGDLPTWTSPVVTALIISVIGMYYKSKMKRARSYNDMPSFVFLIFLLFQWIAKTTNQILGNKYKIFVPFFAYIIFYFWIGGLISIMGFPTLASSIEVPATVALVVFIGTIAVGLFHKRWHFFGEYLVWIKCKGRKILPIPDPLKLIGEISKVVSLSCRLWGNCLASSIILFVCYFSIGSLFTTFNAEWASVLALPTVIFPLHIYFDIVHGAIQALIFMLLTMSYWAIAQISESAQLNHDK